MKNYTIASSDTQAYSSSVTRSTVRPKSASGKSKSSVSFGVHSKEGASTKASYEFVTPGKTTARCMFTPLHQGTHSCTKLSKGAQAEINYRRSVVVPSQNSDFMAKENLY